MGGDVLGKQTKMTKSMHALGAASMLVLMAAAGPARAEALTAKDILSSFNLVTTGNVSTQSDIVGDAVVGGDLSGATFFGGGAKVPSSPTLYLFGKLNSSLNLNSGGSLYYAGSSSQKVNYNGGGKLHTTLPNPLGYYTDPLTGPPLRLLLPLAFDGSEPEAFTRREVGREDDLLDVLVDVRSISRWRGAILT